MCLLSVCRVYISGFSKRDLNVVCPYTQRIEMTQRPFASLYAFLQARVSSEGSLGLHLTAGTLMLTLWAFVFASIAEDVMTINKILTLDLRVSQWLHSHATPSFTQFMLLVTHLHSTVGILALSSLLAIYWLRIKVWTWLITLVLTVPLGMLLNVLLKHIFQRTRPTFDVALLTLDSYSFPSGHAAGATLFYGVLAAWLICTTSSWRWRVFIATLSCFLVTLVGLSRIYLGVHYLSDVLAAVAASSGWLTLSLTAVAIWRRRRRLQQMKEEAWQMQLKKLKRS